MDSLAIKDQGENLAEPTLSVFGGATPRPNRLHLLPELLTCRGETPLPGDRAHWAHIQGELCSRLRSEVFHLIDDVAQPQRLEQIGTWAGFRDAWHGELDGMPQALMQMTPPDDDHHAVVVAVGPRGMPVLQVAGDLNQLTGPHGLSVLAVEPRACGPTAFREEHRHRLHREGCLVGQTPTMMMVQDLHHLWPMLVTLPRVRGRRILLYGKGEGAVAVLYHALLHPQAKIAGIILEDLPRSQADTCWQVLRVLRLMDMPHAVGMLAPRPVALVNAQGNPKRWYYAERVYHRLGSEGPFVVGNLALAIDQMVSQTGLRR